MQKISNLKDKAAFVLRHKKEINNILDFFRAEDIERGLLCIPSELLNTQRGFAPYILKKAAPYLRSFSVHFSGGYIFLDLELDIKQLGPLCAKYMITIEELRFDESGHRLFFSYKEDVKSCGSTLQALALKALQAKGSLLQTLTAKSSSQLFQISGENGALWLDKLEAVQKYSSGVGLRYISSDSEILKLAFYDTQVSSTAAQGSAPHAAVSAETAQSPESAETAQAFEKASAPQGSGNSSAGAKTARKPKAQGGYLRDMLNYSDRF